MDSLRTLLTLALVATALAGCIDDDADSPDGGDADVPAWQPANDAHPAYGFATSASLPYAGEEMSGIPSDWYQIDPAALPETITAFTHINSAPEATTGSGIATFGHYAYVGDWQSDDLWIIDIADPSEPFVAGTASGLSGDIDTIAYPDGRLVIVVSTRGNDMLVFDVTDPQNAELIATINTENGNHNHQTIPGTPIVYNNPSDGQGGGNEIYDLSDPENPVLVQDWQNGFGCHAASFYIDASRDMYRGYCAGVEESQIWDITDPLNPTVITSIPFPTLGIEGGPGGVAPASFSHLAMPNYDGSILIIGDETGGGAAPGCDLYIPGAPAATHGPAGNLWFYDISDETNPVLKGHISPGAEMSRGSCTAHFGDIIGDRDQLIMAFYTAGVVLIDFSNPDEPYIVDQFAPRDENQPACTLCGTWDAQEYNGYVFTGDVSRGMDILGFE